MAKFGIVCSGGLAKGAYQLGFLEAMQKYLNKEDISGISASSIGIYNAYFYCANKMEEGKKLWLEYNAKNRMALFKSIVKDGFIKKSTNELILPEDKLDIPIYISSTTIFPWFKHRYYKIYGNYKKYWKRLFISSVGFPILTGFPKFSNKKLNIDGGVIDNIPVFPLLVDDCDVIIVIHFDPRYKLKKKWSAFNKIILEIDLSVCNSFLKQSFNFKKEILNEMFHSAYQYTEKLFERLFKNGKNDLDYIRKESNLIMSEERIKRKKYHSLDMFVTFLNKLTRTIRKNPSKYIIDLPVKRDKDKKES